MRILIAYASAGAGHMKAAEAIKHYLEGCGQDTEVNLVDVLQESTALFKYGYIWGYSFLVKYLLWLWGLLFWLTHYRRLRAFIQPVASVINKINTRRFSGLLIRHNPDVIISTHFLPTQIAAYLKRKQKINSQLVNIVTDFGVHPFWIAKGIDIYIVASPATREQLVREGVRKDIIHDLGIPVDPKFSRTYERGVLLKKFDLRADKFTVLIATGSFGIGPIEDIVGLLYKEVQILVVCARNRKLYARLKRRDYPNVRVFGFVDNIEELMAASQIIITKPGGMSIAESLGMDLVPIFIAPIPGQETENIKVLSGYGIGFIAGDACSVREIVLDFKNNQGKLNITKENIRKIKKPWAAGELMNVICQGSAGVAR